MTSAILITHQFLCTNGVLRDGLEHDLKIKIFEFCVNHYRVNNPDSYIVITGHGGNLPNRISNMSDWYYWPETLVGGEIGRGHPQLVQKGLEHIKKKRIEYVCKTRLDTVNMISNISDVCYKILKETNKKIINTFYYEDQYRLMDLFMYSKVDTQIKLFDLKSWIPSTSITPTKNDSDGTYPVAKNYVENINCEKLVFPFSNNFWKKSVEKNIKFLSPYNLSWIDLAKNSHLIDEHSDLLLSNTLPDYKDFVWCH
jgi:hypothetical protein